MPSQMLERYMQANFMRHLNTFCSLKQTLFIILLFVQAYCLGQNREIKAQRIENIIVESEAANSIMRDCKNFLLINSCVEPNKDTLYFYQDTGKHKLLKISRILYNPKRK